jgi:hypothetical protein
MPLKRDPSGRYKYGQSDVLINVAMCHTGSDLMAGKTDCIKKAVQKKDCNPIELELSEVRSKL